jgi:glutamate 5-kinase
MVITDGQVNAPLMALEEGALASWFIAGSSPQAARKKWIAGTLKPTGTLTVDDGAAKALTRGKSLLPAGITNVTGAFEKGDAVTIITPAGTELARGLTAYSADDARRIIGHNSREIENLLGYRGRDVLVHRDDLVMAG